MASAASDMGRRVQPLAPESEPLSLSLNEWIEVTIFGLKTKVVQGLLSLHHFENLGHSLRQHLEQKREHKQIRVKPVVAMRTYDKKDKCESIVEYLTFYSFLSINFSMFSTLWLTILKSSREPATLLKGMCKRSSFNLTFLSILPQHLYSKGMGGIISLLVRLLTIFAWDWMRILFP